MTFPDVPCAELTLSEMLLVFFLAILGVIITVVSLFYVYGTFVDIKNYSERISEREIFESYTNIKRNLESSKKTLFFLIISFMLSDFFIVCKAPGLVLRSEVYAEFGTLAVIAMLAGLFLWAVSMVDMGYDDDIEAEKTEKEEKQKQEVAE